MSSIAILVKSAVNFSFLTFDCTAYFTLEIVFLALKTLLNNSLFPLVGYTKVLTVGASNLSKKP